VARRHGNSNSRLLLPPARGGGTRWIVPSRKGLRDSLIGRPRTTPPPLAGGGRGEGSKHDRPDDLEHAVTVPDHVIVPDAQHAQPLSPHPGISTRVGTRIVVGDAIDLDHQPSRRTEEIRDEQTDRRLATKLQAVDLTGAQATPQYALGACRRPAHRACMGQPDRRDPSPRPPPARGGGVVLVGWAHVVSLPDDNGQCVNDETRKARGHGPYRAPKIALPTRTQVAPCAIACSKSADIPIETTASPCLAA